MTQPLEQLHARDMTLADVDQVVALHQAAFPDYFMTGLGRGMLRQFYRQAVTDPSTFAAILEQTAGGRIIGLAVSTYNPAFHTKLMRRHLPPLICSLIRGVFTSKAIRQGLWNRLSFIKRFFRAQPDQGLAKAGIPPANGPEARFLDVAIHPDCRGGGNAEHLVQYITERVFQKDVARLGGSVFPENYGCLIMWKRLGWKVQKTAPRRVDVWIDREDRRK